MAGLPNVNPNNPLAQFCSNDNAANIKAFIVDGTNNDPNMAIVQGARTLLPISMKDFFIPLDQYQSSTYTIAPNSAITISSCGFGEVQFVGLFVSYPDVDDVQVSIDNGEKYIKYEFPTGSTQNTIGKIMLWSGSTQAGLGWNLDPSPGGLRLINPHVNFSVSVQVLLFV